MYIHKKSIAEGLQAEQRFKKLAEVRGFEVRESTKEEQFDHIDFHLTLNSPTKEGVKLKARVDVKARKRLNRRNIDFEDEWVWIELKNVMGKDGWLYGASDFIAFEAEDYFIVSIRKELLGFCENKIDTKTRVHISSQAKYVCYSRSGRQDLISLIKMEDIKKLPNSTVWKK